MSDVIDESTVKLAKTTLNRKIYWDDLTEGEQFSYGHYQVTAHEIIEFATRYDPMEFHVDPEKAKVSPIGALCASGIHTLGIMQRLTFDNIYVNWHIVAGRELRKCQFRLPVLVNDCLTVNMTIVKLSEDTRIDRGNAALTFDVKNAKGKTVLEVEGEIVLQRTPSV
ncbi:MaoC family dehydratase [Colwellia psychrerythraea]|uniref:MaoC domain protein dehydratase n=1 Tax=Colwellia psychrerythraea TaxID=28229 RepID=A0A099KDQ7_COLPS|nr:MaoC family dehydratase [Colwellia psychrerythraea]KGJ88899.1 MaoC domain protein dehydratase [Colwellia psychrerythraea]